MYIYDSYMISLVDSDEDLVKGGRSASHIMCCVNSMYMSVVSMGGHRCDDSDCKCNCDSILKMFI